MIDCDTATCSYFKPAGGRAGAIKYQQEVHAPAKVLIITSIATTLAVVKVTNLQHVIVYNLRYTDIGIFVLTDIQYVV